MCRKRMPCREDIGLLILRTATMIRRRADSNVYMSKVHKITGANGWILGYLAERENEDVYQKDIEEQFGVTRSTVSKVLKGMESKGLLRRENVSSDARLKRLVLTEEGRKINDHATAERLELENRIKKGLSDEEFHTLIRLLKKVADNLQEE